MKNKKSIILLTVAVLFVSALFAQPDQILVNGNFEEGSPEPTGQNQLVDRCPGWVKSGNTADWYTINPSAGLLGGGCPFESGSESDVINAQPKIKTHNGSNHYAGVGHHESFINQLSRNTYGSSKVKIAFWFCPRGSTADNQFSMSLRKIDDKGYLKGSLDLGFIINITVRNGMYKPCQWYYYESDWIKTDFNEYNQVVFGGGDPNTAGGFGEYGYIYIDDVQFWNGRDCCVDDLLFENTSSLPTLSTAGNNIIAGYNVGSMSSDGNVNVLNGQDVTYKAHSIDLEPGFTVNPGGLFSAEIGSCNPVTKPNGSTISVQVLPNVFTPNGDGINDLYLITATGVQSFSAEIFNRDGVRVYAYDGPVSSPSPFIVWDGICNQPQCSGKVVDGTYFFIFHLKNCTNDLEQHGSMQIFTTVAKSLQEVTDTLVSKNNITVDNFIKTSNPEIVVFPNPTENDITIEPNGFEISHILITNVLAQPVYESNELFSTSKKINLSQFQKGLYTIQITSNQGVKVFRVVRQ